MTSDDLSKLKIDKADKGFRPAGRRWPVYGILFLIVAFLLAWLYRNGLLNPAVPVEVALVSRSYPSQSIAQLHASGYVVAQRKAAVASKVTGRLIALMVEEGSPVKGGQVIARLENDDVAAARDQAEANLKAVRANLQLARAELEETSRSFERSRRLLGGNTISRAEFDASEARYLKAQAAVHAGEAQVTAATAALEAAKIAVEYAYIRAPFDAVVLTKNADIGDIVTPLGAAANAKAAVVTIADMDSLQVEADVSETHLSRVKAGQPCEIHLDALPDTRLKGEVHAIVPTADRAKATVMVKVRFVDKDPRVLPEMRAKVVFLSRLLRPEEEKSFTSVPQNALVSRDGRTVVYRIQGDRAAEVPVRTGTRYSDLVEVLEGVKVGDRIAVRPRSGLRDGSRVRTAER
jgi:RND family efflux transporter MFP subunit